jgi:hypothetical protein
MALELEVDGLGPVVFGRGSPRSDTELITPATPASRLRDIAAHVPGGELVSRHSHLQFDRQSRILRTVGLGSVGLPYHNEIPGVAYWALLDADVHLRATRYDVKEAVERFERSGDPSADRMTRLLLQSPSFEDVMKDAEQRVYAD